MWKPGKDITWDNVDPSLSFDIKMGWKWPTLKSKPEYRWRIIRNVF